MMLIVDRPGYFGFKRNKKCEFYDNLFGHENWHEGWEVDRKVLPFDEAIKFYDEAYFRHLAGHPELVAFATSFGECYGYDPSNIKCGCQHDQMACPRHLQDCSLRRALKRLGVWFSGASDNLLEIRGVNSNGYVLHPGKVPFHEPAIILKEDNFHHCGKLPVWAQPDSVEAFWICNKVITIETYPQLA